MSASQAPSIDAAAFQLAAALDQYERDVAHLLASWLDVDRYHAVTGHVDRIRSFASVLPQVSVPWVELLIAHSELMHSLWRLRFAQDGTDRGMPAGVLARHAATVSAMRMHCLRLLASEGRRPA
jgi:hypothetical protein